MPATLSAPVTPAQAVAVVHPWLIRGVIAVLGIGFVLTPFYAWFSEDHPAKAPSAQQALIQKEMTRIRETLEADVSFRNVKLDTFEDPLPVICISGKVANEEELFQLKSAVDCLRPRIKLVWMMVIAGNKPGGA